MEMEIKPEHVKSIQDLDKLLLQQKIQQQASTTSHTLLSVLFPPVGLFLAWRKGILYAVAPRFTLYSSLLFVISTGAILYSLSTIVGQLQIANPGTPSLFANPEILFFTSLSIFFSIIGIGTALYAQPKAKNEKSLSPSVLFVLLGAVLIQYLLGFYGASLIQKIITASLGDIGQNLNMTLF